MLIVVRLAVVIALKFDVMTNRDSAGSTGRPVNTSAFDVIDGVRAICSAACAAARLVLVAPTKLVRLPKSGAGSDETNPVVGRNGVVIAGMSGTMPVRMPS